MRLLPNLRLENGAELSIQDPYTLNDKLIVDINVLDNFVYTGESHRTIDLVTHDGYGYTIDFNNLRDMYEREYNRNIGRRFSDEVERQSYMSGFDCYLNDVKRQCDNIDYRGGTLTFRADEYNYYMECINRLRRQNRHLRDEGFRVNYQHEHSYSRGHRASSIVFDDRTALSSFSPYSRPDENVSESNKKYIHTYNYKPEYIKHYMHEENECSLLLGAEIEVDYGGESEEHAKNVLEIVCGIDSNNDALEDKMYCMHDGSLTNGIEFTTMPCTLEYHKNKMKYKEMFDYLDKHGYKAHDTTTCGLHIHANREYLGKTELMQQLTISKILYILEKFNDEICVVARRDNRFSKFVGDGKNEKSIIELYEKYKNKDKYVALNLKHEASIEFRCFKGTLKYETFLLTLEFVKNIIDYAKAVNIEDIELIKWEDLMSTFSDELQEYYNHRLEKEKEKKENNEEDVVAAVVYNSNMPNYNVCYCSSADINIGSVNYRGYYCPF